ncbi:MAG: hypothetical protein R3B13_26845 [Polyangiaceae bacterium]
MKNRWLLLLALGSVWGCSSSLRYGSTLQIHADQARAPQDSKFRYVQTGLSASASAPVTEARSAELGVQAMNELVARAHLGPNQALLDVTVEEGVVEADGKPSIRVVTLRADVVEFTPEDSR